MRLKRKLQRMAAELPYRDVMTPAFESTSLQSAEAWPAASAFASSSANAGKTGENALGSTQNSFEQILQATFETSNGAADGIAEWER